MTTFVPPVAFFTSPKLKKMKILNFITVALLIVTTPALNAQTYSTNEADKQVGKTLNNVDEAQQKIKDIDQQIKNHKDKIKDLEKERKNLEKKIKEQNAAVAQTVLNTYIPQALNNKYDAGNCNKALNAMENVKDKNTLKYKDLLKNYGNYTQELKSVLQDYKKRVSAHGWNRLSKTDPTLTDFAKAIHKTRYYNTYKKNKKKHIQHLNDIYKRIEQMIASGIGNEGQYEAIQDQL